jgi:hypothetical protein
MFVRRTVGLETYRQAALTVAGRRADSNAFDEGQIKGTMGL